MKDCFGQHGGAHHIGEESSLIYFTFLGGHIVPKHQTKLTQMKAIIIYTTVVTPAAVFRGIVSVRGPGC